MSEITMDEISIQIEGNSDKAIESLTRLTEVLDKLTGVTGTSIAGLNQTNEKIKSIANSSSKSGKKTSDSFKQMTKSALGFITKLTGVKFGFLDTTNSIAEYISAVNRFNYTFSRTENQLKDTTEWVNKLSDAWLLDEQVVANSMSRYYNMTKTMGIVSDDAMRMSKNLTMLTYDLSAFWGDTSSRVTTRIASAMRGEAEGLAEYGISLNQATLQATLYANGIDRTVSSLTAAEKAELVYYQIMKSTANQHGYYAKTLLQPANALEILKTQFTKLGRAIGSIFLPIMMAVIPYVIALTELLTRLAKAIASVFGFELGDWTSDAEQIGAGIGDIGDNAEKAGKKVKGMIADFDELHTIDFGDKNGSSLGIGGGGSLGLDASQFEYTDELMEVIDERLEKARKVIEDIKDYVIAIGIALGTWKIGSTVVDLFSKVFDLKEEFTSGLKNIVLGVALIAGGIYLVTDAFASMATEGINAKNVIELLIGSLVIFYGTYKVLQGLKAVGLYEKLFGTTNIVKVALGVTGAIVGLIGALVAFYKAAEGGAEGAKWVAIGLGLMGVAAIGFAIAGLPVVAVVVAIAAGILVLIGLIQTGIQAFQSLTDATVEIKNPLENLADDFKIVKDSVSDFTSSMTQGVSDSKTSVIEDLGVIDSTTLDTVGNLEQYLNTDLAGTLTNSELSFGEYEQALNDIMTRTDTTTSEKIKAMQEVISAETDTATTNAENNFSDFQTKIEDVTSSVSSEVDTSMSDISTSIGDATKDLDTETGKWKGYLERGNQAQIKAPTFSWKENIGNALSATLRTVISTLGLPLVLPSMAISWFAEGGFPTKGDLFVANEAGAEWVGSMNGRTAVANRDQISTGVREAAYQGMRQALAESDFGGVEVYNYMDSKQIASKMTKVKKSNANMYG